MEQLQSHTWLTAYSYMGKSLRISSYMRKPFLIYAFATAPLWVSLYMRIFFISVMLEANSWSLHSLWKTSVSSTALRPSSFAPRQVALREAPSEAVEANSWALEVVIHPSSDQKNSGSSTCKWMFLNSSRNRSRSRKGAKYCLTRLIIILGLYSTVQCTFNNLLTWTLMVDLNYATDLLLRKKVPWKSSASVNGSIVWPFEKFEGVKVHSIR